MKEKKILNTRLQVVNISFKKSLFQYNLKRLQQLVVTPMVVLQKKTTNNYNIFFDEYSVYHNN